MTIPAVETEPACLEVTRRAPAAAPGRDGTAGAAPAVGSLVAVRRPFEDIPQHLWDGLAARSPWATPFAAWAFHRAWWDAYGTSAHDQTVVVVEAAQAANPAAPLLAIVPLMHRHEVEPIDEATHTTMRHAHGSPLTAVEPTATAVFFGATYHADYATVLAATEDLPAVAEAVVAHLADPRTEDASGRWDVVDLRRVRCGDPAADALVAAFRRAAEREHWQVTIEREDVCPVITFPRGIDFEGYLGTLDKKERHEIRRKVRRAEAAGDVRLVTSSQPLADLDEFIALHQKRWGADGLFPDTPGGECSRRFFRHLFRHFGPDGPARLTRLMIGDRVVASGIHFDDGSRIAYYNAGVDPDARDLSPGVVMVAEYVKQAIDGGRVALDFLRGNEPYKYQWGAVDQPIQRILVSRTGESA